MRQSPDRSESSNRISRHALIRKAAIATGLAGAAKFIPVSSLPGQMSVPGRVRAHDAHRVPEPKPQAPRSERVAAYLAEKEASGPASRPLPQIRNKVRRRTTEQVRAFERNAKAKVVTDQDGVFGFDLFTPAGRRRVGFIDAKTSAGTDVIGLVFLNEARIQEFERRFPRTAGAASLLGPGVAHANWQEYEHWHEFWECSYTYQWEYSDDLYVFLCADDRDDVEPWAMGAAGAVAAVIPQIWWTRPFLAWIASMAVHHGFESMEDEWGNVEIEIPGQTSYDSYGWIYYYGPHSCWFWGDDEYGPDYGWLWRECWDDWWLIYMDW